MANTIQLQLINGCFYPVDHVSRQVLTDELACERIPEHRFDVISPKLVRLGYKIAITGYVPKVKVVNTATGIKVGGTPAPVANPCNTCHLRNMCDNDECGRKRYRLFTNRHI